MIWEEEEDDDGDDQQYRYDYYDYMEWTEEQANDVYEGSQNTI